MLSTQLAHKGEQSQELDTSFAETRGTFEPNIHLRERNTQAKILLTRRSPNSQKLDTHKTMIASGGASLAMVQDRYARNKKFVYDKFHRVSKINFTQGFRDTVDLVH